MDKPSKLETRIYLVAFALILLIALCMCNHIGRTDETLRENREQDQIIDAAVQKRHAMVLAEVHLERWDGE